MRMKKQEQFEQSVIPLNPTKLNKIIDKPIQDTTVIRNELKSIIPKILNKYLTPKEQSVLSARFGLIDGYCKTLKEIGDDRRFKVGGQRIRMIEAKALRKLRRPRSINILNELLAI